MNSSNGFLNVCFYDLADKIQNSIRISVMRFHELFDLF
ncbi:hypothetical protein ECP03048165_1100 [Escherichia coli P0304816.5]|nr:hypothetical protein ECP03048165_1100 [Escherichia coli P0304816.5]